MRPPGEPSNGSYGSTWVPDYMMFEPEIKYGSPLRMELFHLTKNIFGDDYEKAHDDMKLFLERNGLHVRPDIAEHYSFFIKQMAKSDAQVAYDSIFAEMSNINKIKPILYKDPIILAMIKQWPQILRYLKDETLKSELTELTKGGKNIKKRYAKNTKGRRRQVSRKR